MNDIRKDWQVAVVIGVCVFGALAFLLLLKGGERAVCAMNHQQIKYCPGYTAAVAK